VKPTLWFVVPVHGRHDLSAICLRQLRRTCDGLELAGIEATAVVIADAENHAELAQRGVDELGFGRVERDNRFLSRRFNDGIQLALDERYNRRPADYVVPCGSDDFVDWLLFVDLPQPDEIFGFPAISFVRPDGRELLAAELDYKGGAGIRIYPRALLAPLGYRPADEDRGRACDTSILRNVLRRTPARVVHRASDPRQLVDWKTDVEQITAYDAIVARHGGSARFIPDPFVELAEFYPRVALDEMADHYTRRNELLDALDAIGRPA
jgi:hypothetical protein